jgi:hypothetical protein
MLYIYHVPMLPAGPIEAASNTETSCMQAVQVAVIAAGAVKATAAAAACKGSSSSNTAAAVGPTRPASTAPTAAAADRSAALADAPAAADAAAAAAFPASAPASVPASGLLLDRTERLACSLGRMVGVVEQINATGHDFDILLMAGGLKTTQAEKYDSRLQNTVLGLQSMKHPGDGNSCSLGSMVWGWHTYLVQALDVSCS